MNTLSIQLNGASFFKTPPLFYNDTMRHEKDIVDHVVNKIRGEIFRTSPLIESGLFTLLS